MVLTLPLEIGIQTLIVFVGGHAFSVTEISGKFWGISLALGFASLPVGYLIRCIPNPPVERFFCKIRLMQDPGVLPTERPNAASDAMSDKSGANLLHGTVRALRSLRKSRFRRRRSSTGTAVSISEPSDWNEKSVLPSEALKEDEKYEK